MANFTLIDSIQYFVKSSLATSEIVLVRINLASKTGILFPSIDFLNFLKQMYGDRVLLYLDGCQYRNLHHLNPSTLDLFSFISLSFSKFLQVPTFAACIFVSNQLNSDSLYVERLTNPFFQFMQHNSDLRHYKVSDLQPPSISSGAALRCLLGLYRAYNFNILPRHNIDFIQLPLNSGLLFIQDVDILNWSNLIMFMPIILGYTLSNLLLSVLYPFSNSLFQSDTGF